MSLQAHRAVFGSYLSSFLHSLEAVITYLHSPAPPSFRSLLTSRLTVILVAQLCTLLAVCVAAVFKPVFSRVVCDGTEMGYSGCGNARKSFDAIVYNRAQYQRSTKRRYALQSRKLCVPRAVAQASQMYATQPALSFVSILDRSYT